MKNAWFCTINCLDEPSLRNIIFSVLGLNPVRGRAGETSLLFTIFFDRRPPKSTEAAKDVRRRGDETWPLIGPGPTNFIDRHMNLEVERNCHGTMGMMQSDAQPPWRQPRGKS